MAWIAFASVPTILVVMLAMGQLEARLLPESRPRNGDDDPIRAGVLRAGIEPRTGASRRSDDRRAQAEQPVAGAGPHWEVVIGPVDGRKEART